MGEQTFGMATQAGVAKVTFQGAAAKPGTPLKQEPWVPDGNETTTTATTTATVANSEAAGNSTGKSGVAMVSGEDKRLPSWVPIMIVLVLFMTLATAAS